jgi:hypothetical protein
MANAVTHPTAVRNGIADYVTALLDANGVGKLVFLTAGASIVATLNLAATAFGTASGGTCTAGTISDDTNATGGTMTNAALRDGAGTTIIACTVGTSGCDINMSGVVVGAGDTVRVTSLTYSACP